MIKVKLNVNCAFESKKDSNDECNVFIESRNTTDIDEILDQLIKNYDDLTNSLKDIGFVPIGNQSITYNFTEVIIMNTFVETPKWLVLKKGVLNSQNNDNKCFQYSVTLSLYHEQVGKNYCRVSKIKPFINNFN